MVLKNYFKIAVRNLKKFKVFSIVNIAGFSISLAIIILLALFIENELSVDKFHTNLNRIYKISKGNIPVPVSEMIKSNVPEAEKVVLADIISSKNLTINYNNTPRTISDVIYTEPDYFNMFSFKTIQGDASEALEKPMSMVLTSTLAKQIFGNENPIGKIIKIDNKYDVTINAIMKDIPQYSSIQFSCAISLKSLKQMRSAKNDPFNWVHWNYCTYVLSDERSSEADFISKITTVLKNNIPEEKSEMNIDVIPFSEMYYNPEVFGLQRYGSIKKNVILISIGILILLIAIINYVNLSTARALTRIKEIGVRKTVGASKIFLITQFLIECIVYSLISIMLAIIMTELLLPVFNGIVDLKLTIFPNLVVYRCLMFFLFSIILGVLSGIYPAFYLSSLKPEYVFKGAANLNSKRGYLKKGLIIFQFTIAVILITATIVIYNQMEYMNTRQLGFAKDNIIYFPMNNEIYDNKDMVKSKILQFAEVEDFTYAFDVPGKMFMKWGMDLKYEGEKSRAWFTCSFTSAEYMKMMNMKVVEGRGFYENDSTDYSKFIINEAFAKEYNLDKPLEATFSGDQEIVGVVKDFNFQSLHSKVEPLVFCNAPQYNTGLIRLKSASYSDVRNMLDKLEVLWKETSPNFPFEYKFLDETLANLYQTELRFEKTLMGFSVLAVLIACLGLFGLTTFITEQKTKEIGVRKILGASVSHITVLISKQFLMLVLLSNLIAVPISYYFMSKWLEDFSYRIEIGWWVFILSGGVALLIALVTVGYQAIKAATANPIESLKYE
jgi:putative ABC transport system permease protein